MKTRVFGRSAFAVVPSACAGAGQPGEDAPTIVGTGELISRIDSTSDGRALVEPSLGSDPVELLIYDHAGHVAAQLMKRDRSDTAVSPPQATDPNNSGASNGYDAYFGTYEVDHVAVVLCQGLHSALESPAGKRKTGRSRADPVRRQQDVAVLEDQHSAVCLVLRDASTPEVLFIRGEYVDPGVPGPGR